MKLWFCRCLNDFCPWLWRRDHKRTKDLLMKGEGSIVFTVVKGFPFPLPLTFLLVDLLKCGRVRYLRFFCCWASCMHVIILSRVHDKQSGINILLEQYLKHLLKLRDCEIVEILQNTERGFDPLRHDCINCYAADETWTEWCNIVSWPRRHHHDIAVFHNYFQAVLQP